MAHRYHLVSIATVVFLFIAGAAFAAEQSTIKPGTVITMKNWTQYKAFMPDGMQYLFEGKYFWKLPADVRMVIGPPSHYPMNSAYVANTEKYSSQVKEVDLPSGEHSLSGYVAGRPFPHPSGPNKGWEILVDEWYRYVPYEICSTGGFWGHLKDRFGNVTTQNGRESYRRMAHISEKGMPINLPNNQGIAYSEWIMVMLPEQSKYLTNLTLYYMDPTKPEDVYLFIPALRRSLRLSTAARCSPFIGSDLTQDDPRTGFNGGIARFDAKYIRDQNIITIINSGRKDFGNPADYYPTSLWPSPRVGKWEVRPTWVIDARRIPQQRKGYCYGKQMMWIDQYDGNLLWKDNYDASLKLWKSALLVHVASPVPGQGTQFETGNFIEIWYDQQNDHMSWYVTSDPQGRWYLANQECRNAGGIDFYDNVKQYNTVAGLAQVMR